MEGVGAPAPTTALAPQARISPSIAAAEGGGLPYFFPNKRGPLPSRKRPSSLHANQTYPSIFFPKNRTIKPNTTTPTGSVTMAGTPRPAGMYPAKTATPATTTA